MKRAAALVLTSLLFTACQDTPTSPEPDPVVGHCIYINIFSNSEECREYRGEAWTEDLGVDDCNGQLESAFGAGSCPYEESLGACIFAEGTAETYSVVFPGTDVYDCESSEMGCELFGGGTFMPDERCEPYVEDDAPNDGIGSGGSVFQPGEYVCSEPVSGDTASGLSGDDVCTWSTIGGCTEEGKKFIDYAECTPVLTQRPYAPVPPSSFKTPDADPLLADSNFLAEVDWAKTQAESCGCVCCHTDSIAPQGASIWDTEAEGIWTDSFTDNGLAIMAGWIDSTPLGAHAPEDNNGFDRTMTGIPTTDVARMVAFFEGELGRRGRSEAEFADATPTGGPLHTQRIFEPSACENGEGVSPDGKLNWSGGNARYVYILEEGSENPTAPPNLDLPEGTLWRLNVDYRDDPISDGIAYGVVPSGAKQAFPVEGAPLPLVQGQTYYIYVQRDVAIPITRCLFVYEGETMEAPEQPEEPAETSPWMDTCGTDDDCPAPTDYCVKMPGAESGYCSIHCGGLSDCSGAGAPEDWTCNAVNCSVEEYTWCGPNAEIEESGNFLSVCE